ncbi:MAG: hypothetical protein ACUVQ5_00725, partial [Candidatus Methanomethylicaceae archaeon]
GRDILLVDVGGKRELANLLYCSSLLEGEVAKAYRHIAKRVADEEVKYLLNYIAIDSSKHAKVLKAISKRFDVKAKVNFNGCAEIWGELWKELMVNAKNQLLDKNRVGHKELASLIDSLGKLEGDVGEEYLTILHTEMVKLIAQEKGIDLKHYKTILEWIIEDEKRHEQTLKIIKNLINNGKITASQSS